MPPSRAAASDDGLCGGQAGRSAAPGAIRHTMLCRRCYAGPMSLAVPATLEPMESEPVDDLPAGRGWLYEPKWDGFRCIARKDGAKVDLRSRNTRPLARFFPEVEAALADLPAARFVLDGELIIARQPFDTLQLRLHPAASRIA